MAEDKGFFEEILALWFHYTRISDVQALLDSAKHDLFVKTQDPDHCLHQLLPRYGAQRIR